MKLYEEDDGIIRSSQSPMFLRIGVFKKFTIFTGKHKCWSLFLIKLLGFRPAALFKRDSKVGVFLWAHCENFKYTFFLQNTSGGCFFTILLPLVERKLSCTPVIYWLDLLFWKKYCFDFFASIYYLYSYILTITRL